MIHVFKSVFPAFSNRLVFYWQQLKYAGINRRYRKQYPGIPLPDAYTLYESYALNYKKYIEDGELTAKEILDDVKDQLPEHPSVLDWGCGPARITRHLKTCCPDAMVTGSDTNASTIAWNSKHIDGISFVPQDHTPPLPFRNEQFHLVIGFSVLTHIPAHTQKDWLTELHRILHPGGMAWLTTHGNYFIQQLSAKGKQVVSEQGIYNTPYPLTGHRMMSTYHQPERFKKLLEEKFELIAHFDGATNPEKAGKQDLWIVKKV